MKKIIVILISFILLLNNNYQTSITSLASYQTNTYGYYKALSSCLLFKTSDILDISIDNVYFIVPEGYFVKKISDTNTTTLKVSYQGKYGYVNKDRIKSVSFLPQTKYLEGITFSISSMSGTQLWKTPSTSNTSNILVHFIPAGTSGITYIAEATGEVPAGSSSSKWYYCLYSPGNDATSVYEGYIHSEKTTSLSTIPQNLEDEPTTSQNDNNNSSTQFGTIKPILIAFSLIMLLSLSIVILLSNKRKLKDDNTESHQHKSQEKPTKNTISKYKNKNYTLKDKFESFMYKEEEKPKRKILFDSLDSDDDELL